MNKLVFNVILCGDISYASTFDYLKKLTETIKAKFEIVMCLNELTFLNYNLLLDELHEFAKKAKGCISKVVRFGDIHVDRNSGQIPSNPPFETKRKVPIFIGIFYLKNVGLLSA